MAAILAFNTGKAVVQIAAIEIAIDYLLDIGPPEAVLPGEMLVIDPEKDFNKAPSYLTFTSRRPSSAVFYRVLTLSHDGGEAGNLWLLLFR